jgi:hypothetical protein
MKRYLGGLMILVGVVAVADIATQPTRTSTDFTTAGLMVLLLIVPGAMLARKQTPRR